MTGSEEFYNLVDEGREGHNIGLSTGSKKLDMYTDGYLPGTSYLIGGSSGSGKSTYALWTYIYQPLINYLKGDNIQRDPYWFLFSLEMTRAQVYAKLVSMYVFDNYGVELKFKKIFSRGKDCILTDGEAGKIVLVTKKELLVQTANGCLSLKSVQLEGKKRMDIEAFLRGFHVQEGEYLKSEKDA